MSINKKILVIAILVLPSLSYAWHDRTHLTVAKAAGYRYWYNAAGADIAKIKAGDKESGNHYCNNPEETIITPAMVKNQVQRYDDPHDKTGHLYGAIISSLNKYRSVRNEGKYAEFHLAYCAHYIGDLSMPLHNINYNSFNRENHKSMDGTVEDEVMDHPERIRIYSIEIKSEDDLAREIARIANISVRLGYELEKNRRTLTAGEAYIQLGHSASLLKAVLDYAERN